ELREVNDHVITGRDVNGLRAGIVWLVQEVSVNRYNGHRRRVSVRACQSEIPLFGWAGIENTETVFTPSDLEFRLNCSINNPLITACCARARNKESLSSTVGGRTESFVREFERNIGNAVVSRQTQRVWCREFVTRVHLVVNDIHSVQ